MTAIVFALVAIIELSPQTTITKEVKKETVDCRQKKIEIERVSTQKQFRLRRPNKTKIE